MLCGTYTPAKVGEGYVSEKYDGWRIFYTDGKFFTRSGAEMIAPAHICKAVAELGLPSGVSLDGELWLGYDGFQEIPSAIGRGDIKLVYKIFDMPGAGKAFAERYTTLCGYASKMTHGIDIVKQTKVITAADVDAFMNVLFECTPKAEGIVYRPCNIEYSWNSRVAEFMKRKPFQDIEATVVEYFTTAAAKEKNGDGYISSIVCKMADSKGTFKVAVKTMTPPAIGALVTIKYQNLTADGKPRFPSFKGIRATVDAPVIQAPEVWKRIGVSLAATVRADPNAKLIPPTTDAYTIEQLESGKVAVMLKPGESINVKSCTGTGLYCVKQPKDASLKPYCSCPAWKYQRLTPALRVCKHTKAVMSAIDNTNMNSIV